MTLPHCIDAFFQADSRDDREAVIGTFSRHAVVADERRHHVGTAAIRDWWTEAKMNTPHVNQPLDTATEGEVTRVRVRVSGDFPGSPVVLQFAFTVGGDEIERLEIR